MGKWLQNKHGSEWILSQEEFPKITPNWPGNIINLEVMQLHLFTEPRVSLFRLHLSYYSGILP